VNGPDERTPVPGWYVHMEAAHQTAERLRAGAVAPGLGVTPTEATELGAICYTWRNYLALGAIGPDLFYLLPDYSDELGSVLRHVMKWVLGTWEEIDTQFVGRWERWIGPVNADAQQLASQLTGGLSNQLAQVMSELTGIIVKAAEDLLPHLGDWFGLLTSGVPEGYGDDAFYWSDVFHYRRTYQFPYVLFDQARAARAAATTDEQRADADAQTAFAVGWMSHCATDVTGHPFTNAKAGGPYRDHWQRHHLVENHLDAENYAARHGGSCYGEYGTSALHFWLAFRRRGDGPYAGRDDGPAYDYFAGFPSYDTGDTPTAAAERAALFDLDTGDLPGHLLDAIARAMASVHPNGPRILTQDPPFSLTDAAHRPDGRPNAEAMSEMWTLVYQYLKLVGSDALSPRRPTPPHVFTDHSFPTPPGGDYGVSDDPSRGANVDDHSFNLLDLLLALISWAAYIVEVAVWLYTILPGLILDVKTFPAREVIYYAFVVPLWHLYLLARRALVTAGFFMPKPEEVDPGLTTLGVAHGTFSIGSALDDPQGVGTPVAHATEPSGRADAHATIGLDSAYPRDVVRDHPSDAIGHSAALPFTGDGGSTFQASEWVAPYRYPLTNQKGDPVPREPEPLDVHAQPVHIHVGPYVAGDRSTVLLGPAVGDAAARGRLEGCADAKATHDALEDLLKHDAHLGAPIDYGLYLVGRMMESAKAEPPVPDFPVPDFNLDSDRGYAWLCWAWDRHGLSLDPAASLGNYDCWTGFDPPPTATDPRTFWFGQPCSPPQLFKADEAYKKQGDVGQHSTDIYDPRHTLQTHYLHGGAPAVDPGADQCGSPGPVQPPYYGEEWPQVDLGGQG
jgi:hypothetical protein